MEINEKQDPDYEAVTISNLGFGIRSWRYAAIINDGEVQEFFEEPGINNESADDDPYTVSSPEHIISFLQASDVERSL